MSQNELFVEFQIDPNGQGAAAILGLKVKLEGLEAAGNRASESAKHLRGSLDVLAGNLASQAISRISSAMIEGAEAVLKYSANLEQAKIGFTTLIGSAEGAQRHLEELQQFAKSTPFEFESLVKASQLLQGVGIESQRIVPLLTDVGNALSAAGKGTEEVERTVLAISQITSKGKVAGQEINQLAENGISAVTVLSQALGKPKDEILKLAEAGQISSELFLQALHKFVEQNHIGDAMEKQSRTFNGALSNINDALFITGSKAFEPLFEQISKIAAELSDKVGSTNSFEEVGEEISKGIASGLGKSVEFAVDSYLASLKNRLTLGITKGDFVSGLNKQLLDAIASNENAFETTQPVVGALGGIQQVIEVAQELNRVRASGRVSSDDLKLINFYGLLDDAIAETTAQEKEFQAVFEKTYLKTAEINGKTYKFDETKNALVEIKETVASTQSLADQLKAGAADREAQKLLDTTRKLKLAAIENNEAIEKAAIGTINPDNKVRILQETANIQNKSLRQQIEAIDKAAAQDLNKLSKDDLDGAKGQEIRQKAALEINKLNSELIVNQINARKQIKEELKKTSDDYKSFLTETAQSSADNNPYVKLFDALETVGERAQKRFASLGKEAVKFAAEIDRANLLKQINELQSNASLSALKLNQDADNLDRGFIGQTAEDRRRADVLQSQLELLTRGNDLQKQANFDRQLNYFNPRGGELAPTADLAETFQKFKETADSFQKFRLEQRGQSQISEVVAEVNRLKGLGSGGSLAEQDQIAKAISAEIAKIPQELLRNPEQLFGNTLDGSRVADVRALREDQAQSLETQQKRLREQFEESLKRADAGRQIRSDVENQVKFIGNDFTDEARVKQLIASLSTLSPDELTGNLRTTKAKAERAEAGFELDRSKEGLDISKKILGHLEGITKQATTGKGLKVDAGETGGATIEIPETAAGNQPAPPLPQQPAPVRGSFNGDFLQY